MVKKILLISNLISWLGIAGCVTFIRSYNNFDEYTIISMYLLWGFVIIAGVSLLGILIRGFVK